MTSFAHRVRRARLALGLTHKQVGESVYVTAEQIGSFERGYRMPQTDRGAAIIPGLAATLDIPADLLYLSIGRLPTDLPDCQDDARILAAFAAFRVILAGERD